VKWPWSHSSEPDANWYRSLNAFVNGVSPDPAKARDPFDPRGLGSIRPGHPIAVPSGVPPEERSRVEFILLIGLGLHFGPQLSQPKEESHKFFTDFSEPDPLRYWRREAESELVVEQFNGIHCARSAGPAILAPSTDLKDGRVHFHFDMTGKPASFIFRGESHADCYTASVTRHTRAGSPVLSFRIDRRRRGESQKVISRELTDPSWARIDGQKLSLEMDKSRFIARLEREAPHRIIGFQLQRQEELVVMDWQHDLYTSGAVGLVGAKRESEEKSRVFSVRVEG